MRNPYSKKYAGVADIYDTYANADYDLDFWQEECAKAGEVLELTAGTGRVTVPLAKAGVKITALDISRELLAQLRKKCRKENVNNPCLKAWACGWDKENAVRKISCLHLRLKAQALGMGCCKSENR